MDRVWGSNASSSAPSMPANLETGYPRSSGSGTVPGYWWYHMVTESLRAVVVAAGLTPSASDMTQITQAIQVIAKQSGVSGSLKPVHVLDTVGVALSGTQTIDGAKPGSSARVARSVGTSVQNGIYVVNTGGAWARATDMAAGMEVADGSLIEVNFGNTYANKLFMLNAVPATSVIVVGTTPFEMIDITAGITAQLGNYLTIANAASTYLTQTAASATYATKTEIGDMLTKTLAASTYLKKTDAANLYATIDSLSAYLTTSAATATYLSKADANTSYLKKADAATTYVPLSGIASLDGSYTFTNKTLWQNSHWLYWDAADGTDVRMMGLSASNVFYVGDIDLTAVNSSVYLKANSSISTNVGGTVKTTVDSGGLRLDVAPAANAYNLYVPTTSWVRDLLAAVAGGSGGVISIGSYKIRFGLINSGNATAFSLDLFNDGSATCTGWHYNFPTAFDTALDAVITVPVYVPTAQTLQYMYDRTSLGNATRTGFDVFAYTGNYSTYPFYYIAIGH